MRSFEEFAAIASDVQCAPYEFRVGCFQCIQEELAAVRTDIHLHPIIGVIANDVCDRPTSHIWFVQACLWRTDIATGFEGWGFGSQLVVRPQMTTHEVVRKFFVAARDYSEHEVREAFLWRGRQILGPHVGVDVLWEACEPL